MSFKTTKGTELPFLNLKGKQYLEVKNRLIWFREDHPEWGIRSSVVTFTDKVAAVKAEIFDEKGNLLASGHKMETPGGFADYLEKAETGAVGRALALLGYGTQFAQELEIGEDKGDVVDSPVSKPIPKKAQTGAPPAGEDLGQYVVKIGQKFKGKQLSEIDMFELNGYIGWLIESAEKNKKPLDGAALELVTVGEEYLRQREFSRER